MARYIHMSINAWGRQKSSHYLEFDVALNLGAGNRSGVIWEMVPALNGSIFSPVLSNVSSTNKRGSWSLMVFFKYNSHGKLSVNLRKILIFLGDASEMLWGKKTGSYCASPISSDFNESLGSYSQETGTLSVPGFVAQISSRHVFSICLVGNMKLINLLSSIFYLKGTA